MHDWAEIRRRVLLQELSKRAACREYDLHWSTLSRILDAPTPPGYQPAVPRPRAMGLPCASCITDVRPRSVACIAEVLRRAGRSAGSMDDLALLILAPQARVDDGVFAWDASPEAIRRKVRRRVEDYAGERDGWFRDWFEPTWRRVDVRCLNWEEIIEVIAFHRPEAGQVIDSFYGRCLHYNRPRSRAAFPGRRSGSAGERSETEGLDRLSGLSTSVAAGEHLGRELGQRGEGANSKAAGEIRD